VDGSDRQPADLQLPHAVIKIVCFAG